MSELDGINPEEEAQALGTIVNLGVEHGFKEAAASVAHELLCAIDPNARTATAEAMNGMVLRDPLTKGPIISGTPWNVAPPSAAFPPATNLRAETVKAPDGTVTGVGFRPEYVPGHIGVFPKGIGPQDVLPGQVIPPGLLKDIGIPAPSQVPELFISTNCKVDKDK